MCDGRETPPRTTPVVLLYDQRHVKRDTRTFSKCEAQDQPPRHMSGQEIYIFTNTTCYEVRRKNIRNIRTDLGVYFLIFLKCPSAFHATLVINLLVLQDHAV